jgi:Mn-dependent DtxR family transcriptional regulator
MLKNSMLLKTMAGIFRMFRRIRLLHIFLGQFLGQKIFEAVACLTAHFLSDG